MNPILSNSELLRYSRHLLLPELGLEGQERLKKASAVIIGAGGLGSPILLYLAASGVGKIAVVDFDTVDRSNLQRQIIYVDSDVGASKVERAAERAHQLNPEIEIIQHKLRLSAENALEILEAYDVVIDGSDNFATRYLVNDACVLLGKPNVHGSIFRFEGQASVFSYQGGPCYRCLFPEPPLADAVPNCAEAGVLGVMAGLIGSVQGTEAIKIILGLGETLSGKLLLYDALSMRFDTLEIPRNLDCTVCGNNPSIKGLKDTEFSCKPEEEKMSKVISVTELRKELDSGRSLILLDVRNASELALCRLPGSIHIPLNELPDRANEIDSNAEIVVYCKSGGRSMKALHYLSERGFANIRNLSGGITAWANEVDSTMAVY